MDLDFRAATPDDLDRLLEIHTAAYPDPRGAEERRRNFTANVLGDLSDLVVAVGPGDAIVGHAFLFGLEAWFGGRAVRMGAIASVAVAPEARGRGIAGALLGRLHELSDARGDALTMLYAFRQGLYARHGYGAATSRHRLAFDPRAIPAAWRALGRARVRRAVGSDRDAIRAAYDRCARARTGWLARPDALWDKHLARERRQFLVADSRGAGASAGGSGEAALDGYVAFELAQEEPHAVTTLEVDEIVAADDATRLALLGALGAMQDQAAEIELEVEVNDPLEIALLDPDARRFGNATVEHDLGLLAGGPMVRVEDVTRAIEARGYAADGSFDVAILAGEASNGAADEIAVSVRVEDGRAEVASARAASSALRTTRGGLASILYGGVRVADAARLGLVEGDARTLARADLVLTLPPLLPIDPF